MYWGDAVFIPPVGPLTEEMREHLLTLQMFDLTHSKSEVIPVQKIGIDREVDPLIRLFEIHGRDNVAVHDQLFVTRAGEGLLMASSLDHSAPAGQWLLGELLNWSQEWKYDQETFPVTELPIEKLTALSVARANSIVLLNADWHFQLDPDQQGEKLSWGGITLSDDSWPLIQAGRLWETQGYSYDGMAWYRKRITVPQDWKGKRVFLVAEGVDDAYRLWINGKSVARYGSFTDHSQTVFQIKTETDITRHLTFGGDNQLVLQVVDVFGGGGITQPIYLRIE